MKDKIERRISKRFDYYSFLIDKLLYTRFCIWCEINGFDKNSYKVRHNFLVHKGLMDEIKGHPCYDRKNVICPGEFCSKENLFAIVKENPYK